MKLYSSAFLKKFLKIRHYDQMRGKSITDCLYCGISLDKEKKRWFYHKGFYEVRFYECPKCQNTFREYYHEGLLSHTIPKFVGVERRLINFLRVNGCVSQKEIEKKTGIRAKELDRILSKLEKTGRIERVDELQDARD